MNYSIDWDGPGERDHDDVCASCGGKISIRCPVTPLCDHLLWPDYLTDEQKRANGYREEVVTVWKK